MDPWPQTLFTEKVRCALPLIQAPMAGVTSPELVAAVSKTGAVGSLGAAMMEPEEIRKAIRQIRELTRRPFNVNLFFYSLPHQVVPFESFLKQLKHYEKEVGFSASMELKPPPSFDKQVAVLLEERVPIFSFTFGIPPVSVIRDFHRHQAIVIGTATHPKEALALQEMGVDFIVCQGKEAGGHRGTFLGSAMESLSPTFELLQETKESIKRPLIAAGGIMDGKSIRKAFEMGAEAVQMGTAFLTCHESGAHPVYKKALLEWKNRKTELTRAFTGRLARAIENRFMLDMAPLEKEIPPYPIAQSLTAPMRKAAAAIENGEFMALYAGEHFSSCQSLSAQELIARLTLELSK
ncbi:MAG TPA: nitronate monooxygenase [Chlamydiales bacterium]|nr:nitronate monooxygenase [Chlamydiales bacterium]